MRPKARPSACGVGGGRERLRGSTSLQRVVADKRVMCYGETMTPTVDDAEHESSDESHWQVPRVWRSNGVLRLPSLRPLSRTRSAGTVHYLSALHRKFALPTEVTEEEPGSPASEPRPLQIARRGARHARIQTARGDPPLLIRSRSHIIVAMILCITCCGELVFATVRRVWAMHRLDLKSRRLILFAAAAVMAAIFFLRRAMAMTRDLDRPRTTTPPPRPIFSTLSSGRDWDKDLRRRRGTGPGIEESPSPGSLLLGRIERCRAII